jgi:phosphotransferase system HPr-like phosphotransfer protein
MIEREVIVGHRLGLHARAAARVYPTNTIRSFRFFAMIVETGSKQTPGAS